MDKPPAVPAVGYFSEGDADLPKKEVDSIVWVVFARYKDCWKVVSLWLSAEDAKRVTQRLKKRETKVVSVMVPGLLATAARKLRRAE